MAIIANSEQELENSTNTQHHNDIDSDEDQVDDSNEQEVEDERSRLTGLPYDSCLLPKDRTADSNFILSIAPGEGKKPKVWRWTHIQRN